MFTKQLIVTRLLTFGCVFDLGIDRCMVLHEKIKEEQEKDGTAAASNKNPNMKDVSFKLGQFNPGEKYDGIKP